MKVYSLLVIVFLSVSCGESNDLVIDEGLREFFDMYLEAAPNRGRIDQLRSVNYGDPRTLDPAKGTKELAGFCLVESDLTYGFQYHKISKVMIKPLPGYPYSEAAALFHELGHCLHRLDHTEEEWDIMKTAQARGADDESKLEIEAYWRDNLEIQLKKMFLPLYKK